MLDIIVDSDPEWDSSTDWQALGARSAGAAVAESAFPQLATSKRAVELSLRLGGDDEVRALNAKWRGKDQATNVLSFPMAARGELEQAADGPGLMLGDVILAHETCAREAAERSLPLATHAAHLMVHGTLHLLGYDHMDDEAAADMEAREVRALARLGIANPYEAAA
jgi:probable rRNA maturation factor